MREPVLRLLEGIDVRSSSRVSSVERRAEAWRVHWIDGADEPHEQAGFDWLICTAPAPQAAALLRDATPSIVPSIERARMGPTWALLITTSTATAPPSPTRALGDRIAWLAADDQKPGRSGAGHCFVAHTTPDWSEANVDAAPPAVAKWFRPELARLLEVPEAALTVSAHRWRFARVVQPTGVPCIVDRAHQAVAAGDWCIEGRVESAYLSGIAAAEAVRTSIRGSTHA
jgi:predicted NAD/FAD-dependent oxidoreductase